MKWQELGQEFQKLRTEFRGSMPAKLTRLRSLWARVCDEPDPDALEILKRELHTMAGTAGSFGLPQVSAAAVAAETSLDRVENGAVPNADLSRRIAVLLQELEKAGLPPR
jgi:chemotaxis protein histidine kinase CheA